MEAFFGFSDFEFFTIGEFFGYGKGFGWVRWDMLSSFISEAGGDITDFIHNIFEADRVEPPFIATVFILDKEHDMNHAV